MEEKKEVVELKEPVAEAAKTAEVKVEPVIEPKIVYMSAKLTGTSKQ